MQQRDQEIQRLRATVEELEVFRSEVEKKNSHSAKRKNAGSWMSSEREEEIAALRKRLVEYRVAQRHGRRPKRQLPPTRARTAAQPPDGARVNIGRLRKTTSNKSMASDR